MRGLVAIPLLLALLAASTSALAGSRVVLVELPSHAPQEVRQALTRTEAELRAAGFEVLRADAQATDPSGLEAAARAHEAVASIALMPSDSGTEANVWVVDRVTGKTVTRRVDVGGVTLEERPRALAIRAVELLRASLVETVAPETKDAVGRAPEDIERWLEPPQSPLSGFFVQLGGGALASFDGIGVAGTPVFRIGLAAEAGIAARLSWAGPAVGPRPRGAAGRASLRQETLSLELAFAPAVDWAGFVPMFWAGGGLFHLHAEGDLDPPYVGTSSEVWAAAVSAGTGMGYQLHEHLIVMADVAVLVIAPRPAVTMAGERLGTVGRPSLLASAGLLAPF